MRDAIGGSVIITWILIFLVVVISIIAFSFNYAKAFRLKNAILDYIEDGQGLTEKVKEDIKTKQRDFGYGNDFGENGFTCYQGICIKYNDITESNIKMKYCGSKYKDQDCRVGYYTVKTYIYVNVPILVDILRTIQTSGGLSVTGDTSTIKLTPGADVSW